MGKVGVVPTDGPARFEITGGYEII